MSSRAGPVRSNRRQVRQQPYARPARPGPASTWASPVERAQAQQQQQPSLFSRIKQFFWGSAAPRSDAPRVSEPPVLLGHEEPEFEPNETSQDEDVDSDTSTGSRIVHTSQSFSHAPEPTPAVADGPNEALRHFFETKGDAELSNMEVVGVLSLIGQAVSRNESLVDFSQLSMDQRTDVDVTASDSSVLKGLNAPPSPQLYRQGTPPPSSGTRRVLDRSPWSSTPRRSSIRSRYSLAAAPPRRGSPVTASRAPRPSGLRNSLARKDSGPGTWPARTEQPRVTPAASAILQALDSESSPKKRVLASQQPPRISDNDASIAARDGSASGLSFVSPVHPTKNVPLASTPKPAEGPAERLPASLLGSKSGDTFVSSVPDNSLGVPTNSGHLPNQNNAGSSQPLKSTHHPEAGMEEAGMEEAEAAFAFDIPVSTAPRELTPAEEAIVAETQSEFTF